MITIPTISQLYNQVLASIQTELGTNVPAFGKNFLRAISAVQAAKLKLYYLAIANLQKNIFLDTADPESMGGTLERFARIKLGRDRFAAVPGQYVVTVTGTIGATIPASTTFKTNDDSASPGKLFILDAAYVLVSAEDTITIRALEAGTDSRLLVGDQLTSTAPIAGVSKIVTVQSETVEPLAEETLEEYRSKALAAYRLEPNGGSASDYRLWASDAQGVLRVYPFAASGLPGEINLYVEATVEDSTDGFGTPSAALLSNVEDVIELDPDTSKPINERGRRPMQVIVHFLPVVVKAIDIEISGFVGITTEINTTIFNALKSEIVEIRPFVSGADILDEKNDTIDVNKIISTIITARPGSAFGTIVLKVAGVAVSTYTFLNGDIPRLNSVTYV